MYLLRNVGINDLDDIFELSNFVFFINLPPDKEIIRKKIQSSIKSFRSPYKDFYKNHYLFVLEDINAKKIIGVSMIHSQHGTPSEPHFFLRVSSEQKFSKTINTGFIHGTLKLGYDTNGPTEIGGLVLHPNFRGLPEKLGKQISFVRFLYMGLNPDYFKKVIHSELMPPLDKNGNSPLWEAIGRRFMNMDYQDADRLSRSNKEFILNLFPSDTIYQTLLPVEARDSIGKVGADTLPVKKMLEEVGFKYINEVDPFDGGPHVQCELSEIKPIKHKFSGKVVLDQEFDPKNSHEILMTVPKKEFDFCAAKLSVNLKKTTNQNFYEIIVKPSEAQTLGLKAGTQTDAIFLDNRDFEHGLSD